MELQPQDQEFSRFLYRTYTAVETAHLLSDFEQLTKTKLYNFFLKDLQIEIAETRNFLEDTEDLTDTQMNMLRGEIRKMKQMLLRFATIAEHLESVEKNRTKEDNE
jgi:hypothetical protein